MVTSADSRPQGRREVIVGPVQGTIVARDYGIPCVSGVIGVMELINDGDLLEVDGTHGIIRIIEE